jgi:hypothetical protein
MKAFTYFGIGFVMVVTLVAMCSCAPAVASTSLQFEVGALDMRNPTDDQYVLYHANGVSYGVQMTSPVFGAALREDLGRVVLTAGVRDMGHQYIDTDIVPDTVYFGCRFKGTCPPPIERWHARMSTYQAYASIGYKLIVGNYAVVPTVGYAENRMPTTIEITYPYGFHHGCASTWYTGNHQDQPHAFFGVDVERGRFGAGLYLLSINKLPTNMGDPGQGPSGGYARLTVRF